MKDILSPNNIVSSGLCIGCGSCVAQARSCGVDARMHFDMFGQLKPQGPEEWFKQTSISFSRTCPFSPASKNEDDLATELFPMAQEHHPSIGRFITNFAGYVAEDEYQLQGSSGGMVSWVASELMRKNLIDGVVHVVATEKLRAEGRFFKYRISYNDKEIREGAKSRYYPVDLSEVLKIIREVPGRYAVVAVPCMIKAIQLLRWKDTVYRERICFTLGLFCGHMMSAKFLESIAWQMKVPLGEVKLVDYRYKQPDRPANRHNVMLATNDGTEFHKDLWNLVDGDWGAGFFMNSACNYCDDVVGETADISFGDIWIEPYVSNGRGTNVVVVRSFKIYKMLYAGNRDGILNLREVSGDFVHKTQAAGLRQRREGLAYRLTWAIPGVQPVKRIAPSRNIARERKLIYRLRYQISKWSHRIFRVSYKMQRPMIYLWWARIAAAIYYGMVQHQGKIKEMKKRFSQLKQG